MLEKLRVWAVSIREMEFAQVTEQYGQRKEQHLNLGGCWRRGAHFWEGKACQKIELGNDSLGKIRAGKNQKWLTLKDRSLRRVRLFQMHWLGRSLALTSLPSRGGENWNAGLEIEVFSSLKRIENNCGYFLVLFLPLVQAENRTLCNNQRHKVYFFKEMFNANTSGQSFGFVLFHSSNQEKSHEVYH